MKKGHMIHICMTHVWLPFYFVTITIHLPKQIRSWACEGKLTGKITSVSELPYFKFLILLTTESDIAIDYKIDMRIVVTKLMNDGLEEYRKKKDELL